jgi:hypothetical protein
MIENETVLSKNNCKTCGRKLGNYIDRRKTRSFNREYFSITPYIFNNNEYYRVICIDCFYKIYNRLPMSPNAVNYDFKILLDIDDDNLKKIIKDKKSITLNKLIKKYGEVEGVKRFENYKNKQSYSNSYQYKKEKYGWSIDEYNNYNKSRAITLEKCIERHGEHDGRKLFEDYCNKQKYYGSTLEYFIERYGEVEGNIKWINICKSKALTINNFIERYGEVEGTNKFLEVISKGYSKSSQRFFWEIYNKLDERIKNNVYFAELNKEFGIYSIQESKAFLYDFVIKNYGVCIEYNGEHVHPRKDLLSIDEWKKWRCTWSNTTADVKYAYDIKKYNVIREYGYDVCVVWEGDIKRDRNLILNNCLNVINEGILKYECK